MLQGNDLQVSRDPMRNLALYLASYVDTWDGLVTLHSHTLRQFPPSVDETTLIKAVTPALVTHLTHSEQVAINSHDALLHNLVQSSVEAFRNQTSTIPPGVNEIPDEINTLSSDQQKLIKGYYKNKLRGDSLATFVEMEVKELPGALCRLRTTLDWVNQNGVWHAIPGENLLPSLIHEFINGSIDPDSRILLEKACSKDLKNIVGLQRQWRLHLLLMALYATLPFPPRKVPVVASDAQTKNIVYGRKPAPSGPKSIISRQKNESSVSNRTVSVKSHSHVTWIVASGCLLIAGMLSFFLLGNNPPSIPADKNVAKIQDNKPLISNNDSPENNQTNNRNQTITTPIETDEKDSAPENPTHTVSNPAITSTIPTKTDGTDRTPANFTAPVNDSVGKSSVDLLSLIDLKRDAVQGEWKVGQDKSLIIRSKKGQNYSRVSIPYIPPSEYDLRIKYTIDGGRPDFECILNFQGTQCVAHIGAFSGQYAGFAYINKENVNRNKTSAQAPLLEQGKTYMLEMRVRENTMELHCDGKLLTTYNRDMGKIESSENWTLHHEKVIGVGLFNGDFTIQAITIRDITGSGQILQFYEK